MLIFLHFILFYFSSLILFYFNSFNFISNIYFDSLPSNWVAAKDFGPNSRHSRRAVMPLERAVRVLEMPNTYWYWDWVLGYWVGFWRIGIGIGYWG
jgi:hypothetical protein